MASKILLNSVSTKFLSECFHGFSNFLFCFILQASDEYFTFETENITVSIENLRITKNISLTNGLRQTLLIPSDISEEWLLVSETDKIIKARHTSGLLMLKLINIHFLFSSGCRLDFQTTRGQQCNPVHRSSNMAANIQIIYQLTNQKWIIDCFDNLWIILWFVLLVDFTFSDCKMCKIMCKFQIYKWKEYTSEHIDSCSQLWTSWAILLFQLHQHKKWKVSFKSTN